MDAHVNVPHHGGNIVKNSRHLQFLVYTVDFDGRRTRKQMLTGQMPVELMGTTRDCDEWVNVMKNTYDHVRSIMALDEKKRVAVMPGHDNVEVPIVEKKAAQVLSIQDDTANVMDSETYETFDLNIPEELKGQVTEGSNVMYWAILNDKVMKQIKG